MTEENFTPLEGIAAIRLAMAAGADARARKRVIDAILDRMPDPQPGDTRPFTLLIEAIQGSKTELRVTDYEPRVPARGGRR